MERLIASARERGLVRLDGAVLRSNQRMLAFVQRLGFAIEEDRDDPEQVHAVLRLT
jgi:ribosomal protein S18 acetylase RimI-like enzyme